MRRVHFGDKHSYAHSYLSCMSPLSKGLFSFLLLHPLRRPLFRLSADNPRDIRVFDAQLSL